MNAKLFQDIKKSISPFLNPEFIARLVSWYQSFNTVTSPIASAADLAQKASSSIAGSQAPFEYINCDNEMLKALHDLVQSLKTLVPAAWSDLAFPDWMYAFAYEIWSFNAEEKQFRPKRFADESAENFERRHRLAARNTLPKVVSHIDFLESIQEAHSAFMAFEGLEEFAAIAGALRSGTSLGLVDGQLLLRIVRVSRGQHQRNEKILGRLYLLRSELERIAEIGGRS